MIYWTLAGLLLVILIPLMICAVILGVAVVCTRRHERKMQ